MNFFLKILFCIMMSSMVFAVPRMPQEIRERSIFLECDKFQVAGNAASLRIVVMTNGDMRSIVTDVLDSSIYFDDVVSKEREGSG